MKSTWSPAREANAANSSAASIDQSSRGQPLGSPAVGSTPTRPADVRPVSRTMTTRRSRSGRHVRTTTSARRAVARQSIDRTSSPTTYSRSESNSVPWPRISTGIMPSSSRNLGQPRRKVLAGQERWQDPDLPRHPVRALPARKAQRAHRPRGDQCRHLITATHRAQLRCRRGTVVPQRCPPNGCAAPPAPTVTRRRGSGRGIDGIPDSPRPVAATTVSPSRAVRVAEAGEAQSARAGGQRDVDGDGDQQQGQQQCERRCGPGRQPDRQHADQCDQAGTAGEDH